jgi:formylglycine-generating enzyme required for sulfatase activity
VRRLSSIVASGILIAAGVCAGLGLAAGCRAGGVSAYRAPSAPSAPSDAGDPPARFVHPASGIAFVLIPRGRSRWATRTPARRPAARAPHARTIRRPFYLSVTEVTTGQFRRFAATTGYVTDAERGAREAGHGKPEGAIDRGGFAATERGDRDWSDDASWRHPFPLLPAHPWDDDHPPFT